MKQLRQCIYYELDYHELDEIINEFYNSGNTFELVASEELDNGSYQIFTNITKEEARKTLTDLVAVGWTYKTGTIPISRFLKEGTYPNFCLYGIMLELVLSGVIPEGNYLIIVSW